MSDINSKEDYSWIDSKYSEIIEKVAEGMKLNPKEKTALKKAVVAKIVAMLPIIAKCEQPERIAFSNLSTLILAKRVKGPFNAGKKDAKQIKRRFLAINNFKKGNKKILKAGMDFLARCALEDAQIDRGEDKAIGKYNPINDGKWDYEAMREKLEKKLNKINAPELKYLLKDVNFDDTDFVKAQFWL